MAYSLGTVTSHHPGKFLVLVSADSWAMGSKLFQESNYTVGVQRDCYAMRVKAFEMD
jgi:hypothetical protein